MNTNTHTSKSPLSFFLLVLVISIPFWLLAAVAGDLTQVIPVNLPISALMVVCPMTVALILTYQDHKSRGVQQLLGRIFDYQRTTHKRWYLPVIFLIPVIMVLSYAIMRLIGLPLPEPQIPLLSIPIFLLVFFFSAIGEEIGWSGYALDPLQTRWGALLFAHPYFLKFTTQPGFKKFLYADGYLSIEYQGGKQYVIGTIAQQIHIAERR